MTAVSLSNTIVSTTMSITSPLVSSKQSVHDNVQCSDEQEGKFNEERRCRRHREDHVESRLLG